MLGRQLRLPIDLALGTPETRQSTCESDYAYQLETQLLHMHNIARKNLHNCSDGINGIMTEIHISKNTLSVMLFGTYTSRENQGLVPN